MASDERGRLVRDNGGQAVDATGLAYDRSARKQGPGAHRHY